MATKLLLTVLSGPIQGKVFEFKQHDTFIFGRGTGCHAHLPGDPKVSRHHFLLEINPPKATVRDLGSLNGTRVNGVRYGGRKKTEEKPSRPSQISIEHGDRITVGDTTILVQAEMRLHDWDPDYIMPLRSKPLAERGANKASPRANRAPAFTPDAGLQVPREAAGPSIVAGGDDANERRPMPESAEVDGRLVAAAGTANTSLARGHLPIEIGGYRLEKRLGEGHVATVYAGVRVADDLPVAIKVVLPRIAAAPRVLLRFLQEIDVLASLNHANIVALLDSGVAGKAFYFVVEYCNGGNLAELAERRGGKISLEALRPIIMQTLAGLGHAHQQGLIHHDLKPTKILLHQHGAGWVAKLGDFGIAKHFERAGLSGMTLTGMYTGTFDFMPRERITHFKGLKPASDVWSIAATFYRLLTGASPRDCPAERDPMEVVLCQRAVPIRQRDPAIPPAFAALIDKALAAEPKDRFSDAGEMLRALSSLWP